MGFVGGLMVIARLVLFKGLVGEGEEGEDVVARLSCDLSICSFSCLNPFVLTMGSVWMAS